MSGNDPELRRRWLILLWHKKSPDHISICAGLSIVETTATFWRTHLTIHLDISLEFLFLLKAILLEGTLIEYYNTNIFKKLSIVFARHSGHTAELRSRIRSLALDGRGWGWGWTLRAFPLPLTPSRQGRENYKEFCDWLYLHITPCSVCDKILGYYLGKERKQKLSEDHN